MPSPNASRSMSNRIAANTRTSPPHRTGISNRERTGHPDYVDTWPVHGKAGTANAELHPAIAALKITHHFKKGQYSPSYSGFEGSEDNTDRIPTCEEVDADLAAGKTLANALRAAGVTRVDVVGLAESHCVKETALDAKKLGYETHVIENLTEPVSEELGVEARRRMREAGVVLD